MTALHKARLLAMAFGAVTVVMLSGCKMTDYDTASYGTTLDTWIGVHSDNLVVTRGPPDRTFALSDGRQVFAYYDESTALRPDPNNFIEQSCGTPTYNTTGTIQPHGYGYSYESTTTARSGLCFNSGLNYQRVTQTCETRFVIGHDGRIAHWVYEGAGC